MFNKSNKNTSENPEEGCSVPNPIPPPNLGLGIFGTALASSTYYPCNPEADRADALRAEYERRTSDAAEPSWRIPPYPASVGMSYADYIQMQNLFGKLEKFLDAQAEKPYKTNLDIIKSFNSKQLALFVIRDVKKILSGTDSAVEELEAWLNEAPTLSD
jgi:hypothetical protein